MTRASATIVAKKAKQRNVGPLWNRESDLVAWAQRRLGYLMPSLSQSSKMRPFRALGTEENYQQEEWFWRRGCLGHLFKSMRINSCIQECHRSWPMSSHHHSLTFSKYCGGPGISMTIKGKHEGHTYRKGAGNFTGLCGRRTRHTRHKLKQERSDQMQGGGNCHEDSLAVEQAVQEALQAPSWEVSSSNRHRLEQPGLVWGLPCSEPLKVMPSLNYAMFLF